MSRAIYIRTSTKEQTPELQMKGLKSIVDKPYYLFTEKQSAYHDFKDRKKFEQLKACIKYGKIKNLYVWDLDRIYRNRKKLIEFFEFCKYYKCKIHSLRQKWLEEINSMPLPWGDIIHNLMLNIMGWLAEDESKKKSERIKNAVTLKKNYKGEKITMSEYGKKWGRKSIPQQTKNKIIDLYKNGLSVREISKKVWIWKNGNKLKNVSIGTVHKTVTNYDKELRRKVERTEISQLMNKEEK